MTNYEFLEADSEDYFEFRASAKFERLLDPSDLTNMLQLITTTLQHELAEKLLIDGLSSLKISLNSLELVFRFNKSEEKLAGLSPLKRENISRGTMQFVFWFFARIDQSYRLGEVPFPPDFRNFLTFPDEFEL